MNLTPLISSIIACLLIISGIGLGFTSFIPSIRALHLFIGSLFFIMFPFMVYIHIQRFYIKSPYDFVAWMHFITFSFILYVSVRMIRKWYPRKNHTDKHNH